VEQEKRLKRLESHTKREQQQRITSGSKLKIIQDQMKLLSDRLESNAGYERDQRMLFQALQQQLTELGDRFEQLEQSLKEVWRSTQAASVVNADPRIPWWLDKYTPPKRSNTSRNTRFRNPSQLCSPQRLFKSTLL